jgi:hypothetical protein
MRQNEAKAKHSKQNNENKLKNAALFFEYSCPFVEIFPYLAQMFTKNETGRYLMLSLLFATMRC